MIGMQHYSSFITPLGQISFLMLIFDITDNCFVLSFITLSNI